MKELSIVLGLIQQEDNYLLQLRSGDPKIGAANLIGCFGGKIEKGETPLEAVCRELGEETSLRPTAEEMIKLGQVRVISDHQLEKVKIKAEVFQLQLGAVTVKAYEGKLVILTREQAAQALDEMTPGTRAVFERFVLSEG